MTFHGSFKVINLPWLFQGNITFNGFNGGCVKENRGVPGNPVDQVHHA